MATFSWAIRSAVFPGEAGQLQQVVSSNLHLTPANAPSGGSSWPDSLWPTSQSAAPTSGTPTPWTRRWGSGQRSRAGAPPAGHPAPCGLLPARWEGEKWNGKHIKLILYVSIAKFCLHLLSSVFVQVYINAMRETQEIFSLKRKKQNKTKIVHQMATLILYVIEGAPFISTPIYTCVYIRVRSEERV